MTRHPGCDHLLCFGFQVWSWEWSGTPTWWSQRRGRSFTTWWWPRIDTWLKTGAGSSALCPSASWESEFFRMWLQPNALLMGIFTNDYVRPSAELPSALPKVLQDAEIFPSETSLIASSYSFYCSALTGFSQLSSGATPLSVGSVFLCPESSMRSFLRCFSAAPSSKETNKRLQDLHGETRSIHLQSRQCCFSQIIKSTAEQIQ